jgi:hypothetical protein
LEEKWLEGSTGLKNDPQGRQVFPLAGNPLEKFLATLLRYRLHLYVVVRVRQRKHLSIAVSFEKNVSV